MKSSRCSIDAQPDWASAGTSNRPWVRLAAQMISARRLFILLYAASGAAALVYEVAWTRLLTLQMGHTVAAASTVLAAFMGGLAVGAWIAGLTAVRTAAQRLRAYAALEGLIALSALA